ncbi:hypothetical protein A2153_05555 [Candidatus Gottesmanbacteria bacterium RBG_16_38_7b]|uniref:Uncharacterized protein n=1 Tax=Candidatus Gottesmanbacteria bacterium RBG_16_38_7b TaxID=1798372 RepID=A0A1F5YI68_9BACT|nr:MAG: hypothetical protein A2153_05555 [Candidatus Gottesmanbacteria bacterium RBG_16_38_7b]
MKILKLLWQGWKTIAHKIGVFQSKIILTVFYFLLTPFGFFYSVFKDALNMKKQSQSTWINKTKQSEKLEDLLKQF